MLTSVSASGCRVCAQFAREAARPRPGRPHRRPPDVHAPKTVADRRKEGSGGEQ